MVHKKNPNYWMQATSSTSTQFNILMTRHTDHEFGLSNGATRHAGLQWPRWADGGAIQKAAPNAVVQQFSDSNNPYYVYLNVAKPPFNDERIRKALSLGIDRDELIEVLFDGKGEWSLAGGAPGLFSQEETKKS